MQARATLPIRESAASRGRAFAKIPQPLVVHLLVLGRGDEAGRRVRLVHRPVAVNLGAAWLRFGVGAQRLRASLGVVEAVTVAHNGFCGVRRVQLRVQHGGMLRWLSGGAHALAPLRICAIWMNFNGTPMRSAQPRWCSRHDISADTMYSAPARAWSATLS